MEDVSGSKVEVYYYFLFMVDNDNVYILTASGYANSWESKKSIMKESMLSFMLLRPSEADE